MRTTDLLRHVGAEVELGVQERHGFHIHLGALGRSNGDFTVTTSDGLVYVEPQYVSYCETLTTAKRREWEKAGVL